MIKKFTIAIFILVLLTVPVFSQDSAEDAIAEDGVEEAVAITATSENIDEDAAVEEALAEDADAAEAIAEETEEVIDEDAAVADAVTEDAIAEETIAEVSEEDTAIVDADAEEIAAEETVTEETVAEAEDIETTEEAVAEAEDIEGTDEAVAEAEGIEGTDEEAVEVAEEYVYEEVVPESIRNNRFYRESVRLTRLAHETFEIGDYDASSGFAREAIRFAQLSDEFVAEQLIAEAKRLLDWADENEIPTRHANSYNEARNYYDAGVAFHEEEEWAESINASVNSIGILAALQGRIIATTAATTTTTTTDTASTATDTTTTTTTTETTTSPDQYVVRTWARERDCLWNIAGYDWVYGNPWLWRRLYEANKDRLPDPNNPNLIEPGMVLDIPR